MGALDLREDSRVIGGLVYRVQPLPTRKSLSVMTRVLRMAAPGFGDVASLAEAAHAVGELLAGLAAHLDEGVILFVCEAFADVSRVELGAATAPLAPLFDEHFRGRPVELFEWLRFAAEVSFGPLADAAKAATQKPDAPRASPAGVALGA